MDHTSIGSGLDEINVLLVSINSGLLGIVSCSDGLLVGFIGSLLLSESRGGLSLGFGDLTVSGVHLGLGSNLSGGSGIGQTLSG